MSVKSGWFFSVRDQSRTYHYDELDKGESRQITSRWVTTKIQRGRCGKSADLKTP